MYNTTILVQLFKMHQKTLVDIPLKFITTAEEQKAHLCPKLLITSVPPQLPNGIPISFPHPVSVSLQT